jgi:hypothetical protein
LLLKQVHTIEGTLVILSLEEWLLGEDSELDLHAISLDSGLLDAFHHIFGLLGRVLGRARLSLKAQVIRMHLL